MAKVFGSYIFGRLGNHIYYKRGKIQCVRSRPAHVNIAPATMLNNKKFGRAMGISKLIRASLSPFLEGLYTTDFSGRLTGKLYHWIPSEAAPFNNCWLPVEQINRFEFNKHPGVRSYIYSKWCYINTSPGKMIITAANLGTIFCSTAPTGTLSIEVDIIMATYSMTDLQIIDHRTHTFQICRAGAASSLEQVEWPLDLLPQRLVVVAVRVQFKGKPHFGSCDMISSSQFPVNIVNAIYSGK